MTIVPIASRFCFSGATDTHQDQPPVETVAQAKTDCDRPNPLPTKISKTTPCKVGVAVSGGDIGATGHFSCKPSPLRSIILT